MGLNRLMKKITFLSAALLVASLSLMAAGIDGKWTAEMTNRAKKGTGTKVVTTFDFKANGESLTGTVSATARRTNTAEIIDGKVAGNKVSFKTKATTKKGEQNTVWEGTVDGDTFKGTRGREGAKRTAEFSAKRVL